MIKLLKTTAAAAVLVTGFAAPVNAATTRQEYVIVFYDNEAHDHMVGQRIHFCDGSNFRSGVATEFDEETYYGC